MAPKRPSPMEEPPSASSSSEDEQSDEEEQQQQQQQQEPSDDGEEEEEGSDNEEEEGSEDEEESEDEQPQQKQQPNKLSSPPPKKSEQQQKQQPPQQQQKKKKPEPEPESEDDSGSETESESDPEPISASKPMEDTKKVSSDSVAKKPETVKLGKRGVEEVEKEKNKDSKRAKKDGGELVPTTPAMSSPGDAKKTLFQRLWSEDDEIAILKGILEFKEKKGIDATKDMGAFYEFIRKSLECDGTLAQMKDKISRLRRKFENGVKRGKEGENKKFGRAHDQLAFDLSKKIWGSESVDRMEKENGKAKKKSLDSLKMELGIGKERAGEKKEEVKFNKGLVMVGGMEEYVVKKGLDVIGPTKRVEMEEKWRELHVEELELFLKRNELIREQAKLMLASYRAEEDED